MSPKQQLDFETGNTDQEVSFNIDFSQVRGPEPIPAGEYTLEVVKAVPGKSKAQNPKITLHLKVVGGEYDGRYIFDDLTFTAAALFRVKAFLVAAGYDSDFSGGIDPAELVGVQVGAIVNINESTATDESTGEPYPPRNGIKRYMPAGTTLASLLG